MEGREEPGSLKDFALSMRSWTFVPTAPRTWRRWNSDYPRVQDDLHPAFPGIQPAPLSAGKGYCAHCGNRQAQGAPGHRHGGQLLRRVCGAGRGLWLWGRTSLRAPSSKIQAAELPPPAATSPDAAIWWSCVSYRLTTPGTGRELGCTLGNNRELFMGAFHAPHVAGEALKTAVFAAALFSQLGFGRHSHGRGETGRHHPG